MIHVTHLAPDQKVQFDHERQHYTVRAVTSDGRFAICTKPFNLQHTVIYTIVDFQRGVRGPDNLVFSFGYETDDQIEENRDRLERGDMEVSYRRELALNITEVSEGWHPGGAE